MFFSIAPLIAAVLQAGSATIDKLALNLRQISYKTYTAISYPLLFFFDVIAWFIFRPRWDVRLFTGHIGVLLFVSIAVSILINVLYYRALKKDRLSELNTFGMMAQIPVIIILAWLYHNERAWSHVIPALVAAGTLVWAHWERHKIRIAPDTLPFLLVMLVSAPLLAVMSKEILTVWNPISMELVRDGVIALILIPLFHSSLHHIPRHGWFLLLTTNLLSSAAWILFFLGYKHLGVVYTGLLFSLSPLLVYLSSLFLLKERFEPKKLVAFIVVLSSIVIAEFLG